MSHVHPKVTEDFSETAPELHSKNESSHQNGLLKRIKSAASVDPLSRERVKDLVDGIPLVISKRTLFNIKSIYAKKRLS